MLPFRHATAWTVWAARCVRQIQRYKVSDEKRIYARPDESVEARMSVIGFGDMGTILRYVVIMAGWSPTYNLNYMKSAGNMLPPR